MRHMATKYLSTQAEESVQSHLRQLVQVPLVTKEHVDAFCESSQHIKKLDLKTFRIVYTADELLSAESTTGDSFSALFGRHAKLAIKHLMDQSSLRAVELKAFVAFVAHYQMQLKWIDTPAVMEGAAALYTLWQANFAAAVARSEYTDSVKGRQSYFIAEVLPREGYQPPAALVSPELNASAPVILATELCKMIIAAKQNANCTEIQIALGAETDDLQRDVDRSLKHAGFQLRDPACPWQYSR